MDYYLYQDDAPKGPYTLGQLRSMWHAGTITSETPFCPVGGDGWLKLKVIAAQLESEIPVPSASKKPTRKRSVVWMVATLVAMGTAFGLYKIAHRATPVAEAPASLLPANFQPRLVDFMREGSRLAALISQGVQITTFGEQLATTRAAFEMLEEQWPIEQSREARSEFQNALRGWALTHELWRHSITDYSRSLGSTSDPQLIAVLENYAPGRILHNGPGKFYEKTFDGQLGPEYIPFNANIRLLMKIGSEHYTTGKELIEAARSQK